MNIIGEHVDYNDGFVLPFAINRGVEVRAESAERFIFESEGFKRYEMDSLERTGDWPDYIIGVIMGSAEKNIKIPPTKFTVRSNLPIGLGLSSSAALEVAAAMELKRILKVDLPPREILKICVNAERDFVGVECGIMDQYTALHARKGKALLIDVVKEEHEYVDLNLKDLKFAVIDSKVKHSLNTGGYNERKREAKQALRMMGKRSYREVEEEDLEKIKNERLRKRAEHVIGEIKRVMEAVKALRKGDVETLGRLLYESHESLSEKYEVSCRETDFIVNFMKRMKIEGARMVGGGFGGGVLVLSRKENILKAFEKLKEEYEKTFKLKPELIFVESENGVLNS